jgi:hypothetical protein
MTCSALRDRTHRRPGSPASARRRCEATSARDHGQQDALIPGGRIGGRKATQVHGNPAVGPAFSFDLDDVPRTLLDHDSSGLAEVGCAERDGLQTLLRVVRHLLRRCAFRAGEAGNVLHVEEQMLARQRPR